MPFIGEHLNASGFAEGSEAYIRYCAGLAIVQYPEENVQIHRHPEIEESSEEILAVAEKLMVDGIRRIITISYPDMPKSLPSAEKHFAESEPAMREIVEYACERHEARLDKLNESYAILRPAPFLNRPFYRAFCHGKHRRTIEFLDGFVPDDRLLDSLYERTASTNASNYPYAGRNF